MVYDFNGKDVTSFDFHIFPFECNKDRKIKTSCLLDMIHETGDRDLKRFGLDFDSLIISDNAAFLLSDISLKMPVRPTGNSDITVITWSAGSKGVHFIRNNVVKSGGKDLLECTTRWFLVSFDHHKVLRPDRVDNVKKYPHITDMSLETEKDIRFRTPDDMPFVFAKRVEYGDLDINEHMHNTRYADIVDDCVDRMGLPRDYTGLKLKFVSEAVLGDEVRVYAQKTDDGLFISGNHQRGKCFEAMITERT